jgi:hypothetical protein
MYMSRGLRVTLVLVAVALFLCCVAGLGLTLLGTRLAGRAFITAPQRVHLVGSQIADYTVPSDYEEMFAMNLMGVKLVAIGPVAPTDHFMTMMLMQFPSGLEISREEMERQVQQALSRQFGLASADMKVVGHQETTIRGETVDLTVRQGTTGSGDQLRQITGLFQGDGGPAMVIVTGDEAAWDQATVDRFIASIK